MSPDFKLSIVFIALLIGALVALSGCKIEHEVDGNVNRIEIDPIVFYVCINGWLYDTAGLPVVDVEGGQETCSEGY